VDAAADTGMSGPSYMPPAAEAPEPARKTLWGKALHDTFARPGARAGLVWILVLIFLGVFAPFLANSHPILLRTSDGVLQSPLLANLQPVDVLLVVLFLASVILWATRWLSFGRSMLALLIIGGLTSAVAWPLVSPTPNPIFESYRELERAGEVQSIVRTIIPYSPNDRLRDKPEEALQPPSRQHWLGTTGYGEDMLSRMLHACRVALTIGFISTAISVAIGVGVGGVMGYFAGSTDLLGMRAMEIVEAIPRLILLLIITVFFGRNLYLMMAVIGLVSWTSNARFVRAEFLKLRKLDFVQAGIAAGLPLRSIIFRHMLPNGVSPVLVNASFGVAGAILLESTLSFLGLGLGPDDPSWGQMLNQARTGGTGFNWWIATFPGLAIFLTVFSYVLIGEAMRDAIDPKLRKSE
jgi:peptide/nickel transport system permease protein